MLKLCNTVGENIPIKMTTFSDGATNLEVDFSCVGTPKGVHVSLDVTDCNRDIINLCLLKDILDSKGLTEVQLHIRYFPNARADRRFTEDSAHPLKVFCNIVNSLSFTRVYIADPHSDVTPALLDRVTVVHQKDILKRLQYILKRDFSEEFILCAPDLGATKKTFDAAKELQVDYVQAIKVRDVRTGSIVKCDLLESYLQDKDVLIVDDIADGGASFIHLSKLLKERGANKVGLYVTHGIFSKGLDSLVDIDYLLCDNVLEKYINIRDVQLFNNNKYQQ